MWLLSEVDWKSSYLQKFDFFITRPIEYKNNHILGSFEDSVDNIKWEFADITFDEGAGIATEVFHTTIQLVHLPIKIPVFTLEKEGIFDRFKELASSGKVDIDIPGHEYFSRKYLIHGPNAKHIKDFFSIPLIDFFEKREIYHIESNGEALLIFKFGREANAQYVSKMLDFTKELLAALGLAFKNK